MTELNCWSKSPHLLHDWYAEWHAGESEGIEYSCPGIDTKVHKYKPDAGWCVDCGPDIFSGYQSTPASTIHQTEWKTICRNCGVDMWFDGMGYYASDEWHPKTNCSKAQRMLWGGTHIPQDIPVLSRPNSTWLQDLMDKHRHGMLEEKSKVKASPPRTHRPKSRA